MNRISISITVCFFLLFMSNRTAIAQPTALGEWKTHLPYYQVIDVAIADEKVYAATPYSMFTYSFIDNRIELFDKVKGLSDVGINKIGYNKLLNLLLVAYSNANLDLIYPDGSIRNISDIKDKDILGNKTINNITFKDEFAYLSCGFGIVVLDMEREEVKDTYYIGPNGNSINVFDLTYNQSFFYAATESGIYYADVNANNLADFNQWKKEDRLPYPDLTYNLVQSFAGKVYANYLNDGYDGDTVYAFDGSGWNEFTEANNQRHFEMVVSDNNLYIVNRFYVGIHDESGII